MAFISVCKRCGGKSILHRNNKYGYCKNCKKVLDDYIHNSLSKAYIQYSKKDLRFNISLSSASEVETALLAVKSLKKYADTEFPNLSAQFDKASVFLQEHLDKQPQYKQNPKECSNSKIKEEPSLTTKINTEQHVEKKSKSSLKSEAPTDMQLEPRQILDTRQNLKQPQNLEALHSVISFKKYDLLEHLDLLGPMSDIYELLNTPEFKDAQNCLLFALGKNDSGGIVYGDLATMPHLLIAGTTGSGKSVCINSIIMSILFKYSPEEVELIMLDPKAVELQKFNGIAHMKTNVVTDPKKAPGLLYQAVNTMLERYKVFAKEGVRDIDGFNATKRKKGEKIMAKQVIIIDELADLMMANAKEVEDSICRIAQLGRACGMHLIIATSTPHSKIFTDMIKANIPSRIAFTMASPLNSRMVLGIAGAEELLGKGDMLYMPIGQNKPLRVQGCFVSDAENARVISFLQNAGLESNYDENLTKEIEENTAASAGNGGGGAGEMGSDDLIPKAIELALEYEQISTSMLQRQLRIGYARAVRLVDELEMMEIVTPADGNKPREVLITWADYRE